MKFENLPWLKHHTVTGAEHALASFPNGYTLSILRGGEDLLYTSGGTYEVAVLHDNALVYDTPLTPDEDVLGYLTQDQVQELLDQAPELPPRAKETV